MLAGATHLSLFFYQEKKNHSWFLLANSRAVLPALGQSAPGVLDTPPLKVNFGLYTAAKVIKKNALVISAVAFILPPLIPFILKVQDLSDTSALNDRNVKPRQSTLNIH